MKNRVQSVKFSNGPKGNQYVVVLGSDAVKKLLDNDSATLELLQRALKNSDKDDWREFAGEETDEQLTNDSSVTSTPVVDVEQVVPDLSTAKIEVEETSPAFTY